MNRRGFLHAALAGFAVAAMPKAVMAAIEPEADVITLAKLRRARDVLLSNNGPLFSGELGVWNGMRIITNAPAPAFVMKARAVGLSTFIADQDGAWFFEQLTRGNYGNES